MLRNLSLCTAAVACLLLSGCQLTGISEQEQPKPYETIYVQQILTADAVEMLSKQYLPDSGTLSFIVPQERTAAEVGRKVMAQLALKGYAVQTVLPAEKRQLGDARKVEKMKLDGVPMSFAIVALTGSECVEFSAVVGSSRFARVYAVKDGTATPLSPWNRFIADQDLIDYKKVL